MSTAVVNGELLFGFSHYSKGQFFCLDIESGEVLWQGPGRTGDNVMFLSLPGYIVALINDGRLQIIAARDDRFEQVASYRVAESDTYAPPVLLAKRIPGEGPQDAIVLVDDTPSEFPPVAKKMRSPRMRITNLFAAVGPTL